MGWLRLGGSLQLQVSVAKEPYKRDDILQKRPMILMSLLIVATPLYIVICKMTLMIQYKKTIMSHMYTLKYFIQNNNKLSFYMHCELRQRPAIFFVLYCIVLVQYCSVLVQQYSKDILLLPSNNITIQKCSFVQYSAALSTHCTGAAQLGTNRYSPTIWKRRIQHFSFPPRFPHFFGCFSPFFFCRQTGVRLQSRST